jgi:hypothetical protein
VSRDAIRDAFYVAFLVKAGRFLLEKGYGV